MVKIGENHFPDRSDIRGMKIRGQPGFSSGEGASHRVLFRKSEDAGIEHREAFLDLRLDKIGIDGVRRGDAPQFLHDCARRKSIDLENDAPDGDLRRFPVAADHYQMIFNELDLERKKIVRFQIEKTARHPEGRMHAADLGRDGRHDSKELLGAHRPVNELEPLIKEAVKLSLSRVFVQAAMLRFQDLPQLLKIMPHVFDREHGGLDLRNSPRGKTQEDHKNSNDRPSHMSVSPQPLNSRRKFGAPGIILNRPSCSSAA